MIRTLNGKRPNIHPEAFVSETAYIIGDVIVNARASIWPGTVIRADSGKIIIGEGTNVQDNSVIHSDDDAVIGNYVTIGHRVMSHARSIGDNSLVGNGSVLNDGVVLGKNCLVSAGSVITENKVYENGSLIRGIPGKSIGHIRPKHQQLIDNATLSYIDRINDYKKSGLDFRCK
ncbi:MAG: gamma carbonic anhydrase family protein [Dehalococcoidia bacterium]|jgi:carbonic anhydrase/acetyltransferase-like protein (isoleucine patch superfamily)|nr:gamma carbonic anhydrase family protein [Chloroflexota bacterium]MDP6425794.1 gamma carbonic anhydrase family protein [Dehalococcoidia bacterium]MDP7612851.1 gamma carbonic anhydrase family protein [Dehalococcoidia bacterium]|tara:strand:- start:3445 stop:3966 length:522 start_codon:yes stop_codon:yes gene_type:complete